MASHHPVKLGNQGHCGSEGITVLICHVILQDSVAQEPYDLFGRSALRQITTMTSLVTIGSVVVGT